MDYKMAVKVKNFLKKNDPVEFSDTFGDNDPEDFTAIDIILKNNNRKNFYLGHRITEGNDLRRRSRK